MLDELNCLETRMFIFFTLLKLSFGVDNSFYL